MTGRIIDAHLHLWRRSAGAYGWLTPEHGALFADFDAEQAHAELEAAGVDAAILVQADDTLADTAFLLEVAEANPWVAGVVGWIPLDDVDAALEALEEWGGRPAFCGVRHLVHDDPRDDVLALPTVRASLAELARRDIPFDVPDAWPRHLDATVALAEALPELRVVIDHLAKPPLGALLGGGVDGAEEWAAWLQAIRRAAALPNTVVKFSGLRLPGAPFDRDTIRPLWDIALEQFGPSRIMYGGDWPMTVGAGGYQPTWGVLGGLIGELSTPERSRVLGGTAEEVYHR